MYKIKRLWLKKDKKAYQQWKELLENTQLSSKEEADYTIGIYDDTRLIATGSFQQSIIKCVAVDEAYRSENLLAQVIMHLISKLREEGTYHYFVYTKPSNRLIFRSLGFQEIIGNSEVLFMEQGITDFNDYLQLLKKKKKPGAGSAIVMNANPFTKGHQYLVETAAKKSEQVYVFVLSEDRSEFSAADRMEMVKQGVAHLPNVTVLPTNNYLVSSATFPSYFLKEHAVLEVAKVQAALDVALFKEKIAPALDIRIRFVGEEPYSEVTNVYNQAMETVFGDELDLTILPRIEAAGEIISATKVRNAIKEADTELLWRFLPSTTYSYLKEHNILRGEEQWKSKRMLSLGHSSLAIS